MTAPSRVGAAIAKALEVLRPPPRLSVSEWSDTYRQLSPEGSAAPGRWRTDRAEYQRGILDAMSDRDLHTVIVMAGAQLGKSEALLNVVGYHMHQDPAPVLFLQPTVEMAGAFSKDRVAPMLRDTRALRDLVGDAKGRDGGDTILHKAFPGGHLTLAGANSPASLASRPVRIGIADEVDRFPASAGEEGDPVALMAKRLATFWNRKLLLTSTPTDAETSRIAAAFSESDQRRFHIPCPHCGAEFVPEWRLVTWPTETDEEGAKIYRTESAALHCAECGAALTEAARLRAIRAGRWIATSNKGRPGVAGFHLSQLVSPWVTPAEMAAEFVAAKDHPERLKVFVNTALGETWNAGGKKLDPDALVMRRENYTAPPVEVGLLTAAVDVQDDRLELEVCGWGMDEESWGVELAVFHGDPGRPLLWQQLDAALMKVYQRADGVPLTIAAAVIDSGGHYTQQVYQFTKPRLARRVYAIKGVGGWARPIVSRPSKANKERVPLFSVGVDTAKDLLVNSRLKISKPGPGYCHFPTSYDDEYFDQLTAEKMLIRYRNGVASRYWKNTRSSGRNEGLDLRVYNIAAYYLLNPNMPIILDKLAAAAQSQQPETPRTDEPHGQRPTPKPRPEINRPRHAGRPGGGGFVNAWR